MKLKNKEERSIYKHFSSETILKIGQTTSQAILIRKWLAHVEDRNLAMMMALKKRSQQQQAWRFSFSCLPLLLISIFACPMEYFLPFRHLAVYRLITAAPLGALIAGYFSMMGGGRSTSFCSFLFSVGLSFFISGPNMHALHLEDTTFKLFCSLSLSLLSLPLLHPISRVLFVWRGNKVKWDQETKRVLNEAINATIEATARELAELIQETSPECQAILNSLNPKLTEGLSIKKPEIIKKKAAPKEMALPLYMGLNEQKEKVHIDIAKAPHLLVGGASGGGKSNFLNHLIMSLLDSGECNLTLIDPEEVELDAFRNEPNVFFAGSLQAATARLATLKQKMEDLRSIFTKQKVKNIAEYNALPKVAPLLREVAIVDEYANYSKEEEFKALAIWISRLGRKYGVHLVIATQRPSGNLISNDLKANLQTKVAFRASSKANSKIILDAEGAEKISQQGLCILSYGGAMQKVQTPLAKKFRPRKNRKRLELSPAEEIKKRKPENSTLLFKNFIKPATPKEEGAHFAGAEKLWRFLKEQGVTGLPSSEAYMGRALVEERFKKRKQGKRKGYWYRIAT